MRSLVHSSIPASSGRIGLSTGALSVGSAPLIKEWMGWSYDNQ